MGGAIDHFEDGDIFCVAFFGVDGVEHVGDERAGVLSVLRIGLCPGTGGIGFELTLLGQVLAAGSEHGLPGSRGRAGDEQKNRRADAADKGAVATGKLGKLIRN